MSSRKARVESEKSSKKSAENFLKQEEKRFFVQNCLSVVQKCPEALFESAQKCGSKVLESVVQKCPEVLLESFRKPAEETSEKTVQTFSFLCISFCCIFMCKILFAYLPVIF